MITTDFAPNETGKDAFLSASLLLQPWRWQYGKETGEVQKTLTQMFTVGKNTPEIHLFLTGRSSLYYLLESLSLSPCDVMVQAFTCEAVVLPIYAAGMKPVYVDIDPKTYSMDIGDLKKKRTPNAKIIILQHTFGIPPNRKEVLEFAHEHSLFIIEDLAHGFETKTFMSDDVPTTKLLSFGRSKSVSSVFGGAIVSYDAQLNEKLSTVEKELQPPGLPFIAQLLLYKPFTVLIKSTYDILIGKLIHTAVNGLKLLVPEITRKEKAGSYDDLFNHRYPNALAILLQAQLDTLTEKQETRKHAVTMYDKELCNGTQYSAPLIRYPLRVKNREGFMKAGIKNGLSFGKWYDQVVAPKDIKLSSVGYTMGTCPVAEQISEDVVNLPTLVTPAEAQRIIQFATSNR
jgi:perosamine synthetase